MGLSALCEQAPWGLKEQGVPPSPDFPPIRPELYFVIVAFLYFVQLVGGVLISPSYSANIFSFGSSTLKNVGAWIGQMCSSDELM